MNKKFNFTKNRDTLAGFLFIRAITESKKPIEDFKSDKEGNDDVKLTVNGIEVPFKSTIDSLDKHMDEEIIKEAKRLLKEALSDKLEKVEDVFDELTDLIESKLEKLI